MYSPLVSIIIPVFNCENYLSECIESAINQTYLNKEIIIINDGSTDNSLVVAEKFKSSNVKIYSQKNRGASAARNFGLQKAKGSYIQFLDSDDLISSNKINSQVTLLSSCNNKIAVCNTVHFHNYDNFKDLSTSAYEEDYIYNCEDPITFLIKLWGGINGKGSMIQPNAWLTPKKLIDKVGKWNEELTQDDDGEFFCRILLNSDGVIKCNNSYNYYRKHTSLLNLSSNKKYKDVKSLINSSLSKKNELFKRSESIHAKMAIQHQLLHACVQAYPEFPDLVKLIESNYPLPHLNETVLLGGKVLNMISSIFGWKIARRLQIFYQNSTK